MSLRFRLNLMISLTLLVIIGAGGVLALDNARRSVQEEVDSSVKLAQQLVEAELIEHGSSYDSGRWLARLTHLESARHLRIQVEQQGHLSSLDPSARDSSEAPPAWFQKTVTPPALRAERELSNSNGVMARILIEADPNDEISEAWREARGFFLLMSVLAISVLALVYFTLGRAFNAVSMILNGLRHMEDGYYEQRLPGFSVQEFGRISDAFNHLAESLGKARRDTLRGEEENQRLTRRLLQVQEDERRAMARELHDELGQSLSAIKALAVTQRQMSKDDKVHDIAVSIASQCDHLFPVVRGMMQRMRPLMLEELGLKAALEDLLDGWRKRSPHIRWSLQCDDAADSLSEPARINLYRIVQEALSNAVKHAMPSSIQATLSVYSGQVSLNVADDGCGYDPGTRSMGMGLSGMRERVKSLEGEFLVHSAPGRGTTVSAIIPIG